MTDTVQRLNWRVSTLIRAALACRLPLAAWRSPQPLHAPSLPTAADAPQVVVDLSGAAEWTELDFHAPTPGFVFSPFHAEQQRSALLIKAGLHLTADGACRLVTGTPAWPRLQQAYEHAQSSRNGAQPSWYTPLANQDTGRPLDRAAYCRLVQKAIAFIAASDIEKVVVSRRVDTPLPDAVDPASLFQQLCRRYPEAFVSLVAVPGVGTWLGATPELLLAVDSCGLSTMALAGTQACPQGRPPASVQWGPKERTEQALVSAYVRDFFQRRGIAGVQEEGPTTVAAGNLVHLRTTFRVDLPEPARLTLANQVLHDLHPTSAVCGMPKDKALAFILAHEGYDRSFYSGFLGPVYLEGCSSLYVNLRCMQLRQSGASLYVGGGVTADSDPCAEWEETGLKAQTLLSVLEQQAVPGFARAEERHR